MNFKPNSRTSGLRILHVIIIALFSLTAFSKNISSGPETPLKPAIEESTPVVSESSLLYQKLHLADCGLKQEILEKAIAGYENLRNQNLLNESQIISIVDFSQSSKAKRLYIIDMAKGELLFQTWVAHGRNSGNEFANSFSNEHQSYKSSPGFYVTGSTYSGKHGLSLRLHGMEKGINDNAENRAIVIHGASYVSQAFINQTGRLGRSQGCPAVSEELSGEIITAIKNGSCFFIYH